MAIRLNVGSRVGRLVDGMIVEEGIVVNNEDMYPMEDRSSLLERVLVRIDRINLPEGGQLGLGTCVIWDRVSLVVFEMEADELDEDGNRNQEYDSDSSDDVIQKSSWMSLIVKVVDTTNVIFGVAMVSFINPDAVLVVGGAPLGHTHVGILMMEFMDSATTEHLKYKDCLVPWEISKLIASGGKRLSYHYENQEAVLIDVGSKTRSYVNQVRPRKQPNDVLSRKEKLLTQEEVFAISTQLCCRRQCCQHFEREVALGVRKRHLLKCYTDRKLEETLAIKNSMSTVHGEVLIGLEGTVIFLEAWRIIHGKGKTQFNETKRKVQARFITTEHGNRGKKRMSGSVSQALMTTQMLIDESADYHPAKLRTLADNSRVVLRELPSHFTWETMRGHVNDINIKCGEKPISQPTMSHLHKKYFENVSIHKKGNSFSKYSICSELQARKAHISGKEELQLLRADEKEHHDEHSSRRLLYHAWRAHSIAHPKESICIIHDKMDHCKTALPRLPRTPKGVENSQQLPITLTGILTHGHGPKAIAQYNVRVWPGGPNATIKSLDTILRMLENPDKVMESVLEGRDSTNLFSNLMLGREEILGEDVRRVFKDDTTFISNMGDASTTLTSTSFKQLPRILRLQLDNCAGDNKNRFVMAYLSLLTARQVFEEVHMGFLMVGHTHEDVDAMFGNFSESLMHNPTYTLPNLMSVLLKARTPNAVPHFIQEVPDFKSYLEPYMLKGGDALVGHLKPRLYRFYVWDDGMPCFQYKIKSDEVAEWMPNMGIEMWSWIAKKLPNLPTGLPKRLPMVEMKILEDVKQGIEKYVGFFELVEKKSATAELKVPWSTLVKYWKNSLHTLEKPVQYEDQDQEDLVYGFWPRSNWKDHIPITFQNVACVIDVQEDYVGPVKNKSREAFQPRLDIVKDHFILQRPATLDAINYPIHMGRVVSDVEEGEVNNNNVL